MSTSRKIVDMPYSYFFFLSISDSVSVESVISLLFAFEICQPDAQ